MIGSVRLCYLSCMEKMYVLQGYPLTVYFDEGLVRIVNDTSFKRFAVQEPLASARLLVSGIQSDYLSMFGERLRIADDSLAVEIMGHLYAEYYLLRYNRLLSFILPKSLYKRLRRSCEVIDCGEWEKDGNRWIWDRLVPIRGWLGRRLALCHFPHVDGDHP